MNPVTALGLVAAALTTLSFLPQVIKTWRAQSAEDLSIGTFSMLCTGVLCWLIYGLLIEDLPIIVSNVVTFVLVAAVLAQAVIYKWRDRQHAHESPED
jgi:MtN3 and saliva related transmembrane protein